MFVDFLADCIDRGYGGQHYLRQGRVLAQKAQQQAFRLNVGRAKLAGFVAREENDAPCLLCIALKHSCLSSRGESERKPKTISEAMQMKVWGRSMLAKPARLAGVIEAKITRHC